MVRQQVLEQHLELLIRGLVDHSRSRLDVIHVRVQPLRPLRELERLDAVGIADQRLQRSILDAQPPIVHADVCVRAAARIGPYGRHLKLRRRLRASDHR